MNLRHRPKAPTRQEQARLSALRRLRERQIARHQGEERHRHERFKEQIWHGDE